MERKKVNSSLVNSSGRTTTQDRGSSRSSLTDRSVWRYSQGSRRGTPAIHGCAIDGQLLPRQHRGRLQPQTAQVSPPASSVRGRHGASLALRFPGRGARVGQEAEASRHFRPERSMLQAERMTAQHQPRGCWSRRLWLHQKAVRSPRPPSGSPPGPRDKT